MDNKTITAHDLRRNHEGKHAGDYISIDGVRYFIGRYFPRTDEYELIEQIKAKAKEK